MSEVLCPRDHAERVALFRAELIGALARRELDRGELAAALRALAAEFYRPPGSRARLRCPSRYCCRSATIVMSIAQSDLMPIIRGAR